MYFAQISDNVRYLSDKDKSKSAFIKILKKQYGVILLMQLNLCEHACHLSLWLKSITTQNEVDPSLKIMKTDEKCPWSKCT